MDQLSFFHSLLSWCIVNDCWVSHPFIIFESCGRFRVYSSVFNGLPWPDCFTITEYGSFSSLNDAKSFCQSLADST